MPPTSKRPKRNVERILMFISGLWLKAVGKPQKKNMVNQCLITICPIKMASFDGISHMFRTWHHLIVEWMIYILQFLYPNVKQPPIQKPWCSTRSVYFGVPCSEYRTSKGFFGFPLPGWNQHFEALKSGFDWASCKNGYFTESLGRIRVGLQI